MEPPRVRYAKSGDLNIAYRVSGNGPLDLLFVPAGTGLLDMWWEGPFSAFREQLEASFRLITLDKRGMGFSDRLDRPATLEERMDDIRAVLDAVGSERAGLVGASEGGPVTCLFAATYPHRVAGLVLLGAVAKWSRTPDFSWGFDEEWDAQVLDYAQNLWGTGLSLTRFAPSVADDVELRRIVGRYERMAGTPSSVAMMFAMNHHIDVRPVLPTISAPTLVLHRIDDRVVDVGNGRYLAAHIPGARLVELSGEDHWPLGDVDDLVGEIEEFLLGHRHAVEFNRVLTTVLFTDIVNATTRASESGDSRWRVLLDQHDDVVRRHLWRYEGREIKTTGDGFLASFSGPARAIRCAQAIVRDIERLGLRVRAGLHTGECELRGDDIAGLAVHIAARVAAEAGAGEVVVSESIPPLVVGAGIEFVDRGRHELKGVPGAWRLFAAQP